MGAEIDDAYLVQRAREGYVDAYAELVDRHGQLAYRVALRLLGNHHDAEDVAQEALVTAWQQLPPATGDEPAQQTERDLTASAITAAVAALPPPQRIAIVLRHFEGLSNAEIARITESTIPAVRSHLFRGRRTLSQVLEQWR